ncbi:SusC/RagA family TonB-linked outer membrane protein [Aestuariivivens insulae]|uniref:SusC/RagA family TonB-linked outer membrane protein n=1 Tax=Aestuariivivens insulae TaxID=1621988 RepID=UPI001F570089|nr:TonB-dependent receptor [Aestuariivivens insulae]
MKTVNFLILVSNRTKGIILNKSGFNKSLLALLMMFMINQSVFAQEKIVTGTIIDGETQQPLPGATVLIKGTSNGTSTDFDGNFSLKVTSKDAIITVSYVGYETKEVLVGSQTEITITLAVDSNALDEVVVVGFGTQKRENISGAVVPVDMKKLEDRPTANVSQSLQGTVANLNVTFANGAPGGSASINIRGAGSIGGYGSSAPLIVIDGVPSSSGDLTRLNPDDVESMSVLKDASSAAIYGARAAYGVLLVTTKKGKKNKVTYSNSFIWGKPTVTPKPITDPYIYSRLLDISTSNTPWNYVSFDEDTYAWARARSDDPTVPNVRLDPNSPTQWQYMGDNNWNDYFFDKVAYSENHNVSISGTKDIISYYVSANHTKENGLNRLTTDDWTRDALRSKINVEPYSWMDFENNTFLSLTERRTPTYGLTNVYNLRPTDVAKNPDGTWANTAAGHAAARMIDGGKTIVDYTTVQTTNKLNLYFFNKDLKLTGEYTFKKEYNKDHWDGTKYQIGYGPDDIRENENSDYAYERMRVNKYSVLNVYATYDKTFNKHKFNAVVGYNKEVNEYESFWAQRTGLLTSIPNIALASGEDTVGYDFSDWAVQGIFGRLNYIYDEQLVFEFNGRYDGSSRFPKEGRYGFFPSVSAAWIASKNFSESLKNTINHFKIKGSWGALGNQNAFLYAYYNPLPKPRESSYLIGGDYPTRVSAPGLAIDPTNYSWERVVTTNLGVELGFFDNMLSMDLSTYYRNVYDMLQPGVELPAVLGTNPPFQNSADQQTIGWEATINYTDSFTVGGSPLDISASIVLSDNQTTITRFKNDSKLFSGWREGQKRGEIWGLESDGFFQSQEEIDNLDETAIIPWGALTIVPGWPKFVDQDGDGKILRGSSELDPKDLKVIGNRSPRYNYGFNFNVSWKGFDVSGFLQGVGKRDYYPTHYLFWGPYQQPYANVYPHLLNFYRAADDSPALMAQHSQSYIDAGLANANTTNVEYPVLQSWLADRNYGSGLAIPNTKYLLSAAYLRLKNVTVGYSVPDKLLDKLHISKLRFFVTGENIFEWSDIKGFVDPEATGAEGYAYPFQRKLSMGLNVTF